jgi:polyketide synthase PksM
VHAAIVLLDRSLSQMDEARFVAALSAKVDVSVRLAQVFGRERLDFALFFSSMQSFTKAAGQSNYAAGCTFKDAFAQQLARHWSCPVKVMNWAYWGGVGVVASDGYRARMAQLGIGSIEPADGMAALDALLDGPLDWLAYMKVTARFDRQAIASVAPPRAPETRRTSTMQAIRAKLVSGKTRASAVEALHE